MHLSELPALKMPYRAKDAHRFFVWCILNQPHGFGVIGNLTIPIDSALDIRIHILTERFLK